MKKIFISYRHKDAAYAQLLASKLETRLNAKIITDHQIDQSTFSAFIEREITECAVFVSVVTPNTFDLTRIYETDDWIRREISLALRFRPESIVIALMDGCKLPSPQDLPEDIRNILQKQAIDIYVASAVLDKCVDKFAELCTTIGVLNTLTTSESSIERNTFPKKEPSSSIHVSGDQNVTLQGTTVEGGIHVNYGSREQERLARRQRKVEERDRLAKQVASLTYPQKPAGTLEGSALLIFLLLVVVAVAASINTLFGVVVFCLMVGFTLLRLRNSRQEARQKLDKLELAQHQLNLLNNDIHRIDQEK